MDFMKLIHGFKPNDNDLLETYDHKTSLETAVKEAHIMVRFASEHKKNVDDADIIAISAMQSVLTPPPKNGLEAYPTPQQEVAFWKAYENLATIIAPATVESILMTRGLCEEMTGESKTRSPAGRKVRWYKWFTLITFGVLFVLQIFWFFGNQTITDLEAINQSIIVLENQISAIHAAESKNLDEANNNTADVNKLARSKDIIERKSAEKSYPLLNQLTNKEHMQEAANLSLKAWNRVWSGFVFFITYSFDQEGFSRLNPYTQNRVEYKAALSTLSALSNLILPLLFALLGSAVYVLRSISQHIENNDLSSSTLTRMPSRLILGMISGVAMSWLIMPGSPSAPSISNTSGDIAQTLGLLKSLGPWLTAFVAGYSVEIFFSFLDTIILSFTKKKTHPVQ